eukprot:TRINITY_DN2425_c0_g2_i7.p1 TRINITY_DN2425_c0_g2~~TRINITY_DN2425_c0_g2_i7.p1  ORF type:complete len:283 (+),score=61.16 TRINITY_DN2425_c0_g2_i7:26-874(+)
MQLFFFFKQKTAYEISACLVGSEMCIRDRSIQQDNQITLDILEEAFRIKIMHIPNQVNIANIIEHLFVDQYEKDSGKLQKLDFIYILFKLSNVTHPSMDHFLTKKRNENMKNDARRAPSQKNISEIGLKKKTELKLEFHELIEKYLTQENSIDMLLQEQGITNSKEYLPLLSISTQRDKSNVYGDLTNLLNEKFDALMPPQLSENLRLGEWSSMMKITCARNLIRISQGIPSSKFMANEWKACKYWDKYYKIDYRELLELAMEVVESNVNEGLKFKKVGKAK